jgi:glutathione reductase (NADPH)
MRHVDLFVIGAGSGGVRAARMAAAAGATVAIAESGPLGGTCVNLGCVPKKLMVYAAQFGGAMEDAAGFGWTIPPAEFSWPALIRAKNDEILRLNGIYERLLASVGVEIILGRARLEGPATVSINGEHIRADRILVATGSTAVKPEIPGAEHGIVSDDAFHLEELPRRVVVIGGGYIGVEFAGIFNGLGAEVVQLYRGPLFLRGFDHDLRLAVADAMRGRGVDLRFDCDVQSVCRTDDGLVVTDHAMEALKADCVLFATGRRPNTGDLGLEEAGVALGAKGEVLVDEASRSSVDTVFAIGDCTDRMNLTPVAIEEAMRFVRAEFGDGRVEPVDYGSVATAVFSQPNAAAVGLTEEEARSRELEVEIYRSTFRPMMNTLSGRDERSMMKIVVDRSSDRVLGFHMVGPEAGEIVQGLAVAMQCGVTKTQLDATVGIHPTSAEEFVTMREPVPQESPRRDQ